MLLPEEEEIAVICQRAAIWRRAGAVIDGLGVVVAHPHPHKGGSMDDRVVMAVVQELCGRENVTATLRFQFSPNLKEGPDQLAAALALLRKESGVARIACVGYSFGAGTIVSLLMRYREELLGAAKPLVATALVGLPMEMVARYEEAAWAEEAKPAEEAKDKLRPILQPEVAVIMHSLVSASELNGKPGHCKEWVAESGRWRVQLQSGETKLLKSSNLAIQSVELVPGMEDNQLLRQGVAVIMHSLTGAAELNGLSARCDEWLEEKGRWRVRLESGQQKDIKPGHLALQIAQPESSRASSSPPSETLRKAVEAGMKLAFVAGDRDFVCPGAALEGFASKIGSSVSTKIIPGGDHFFANPMHLHAAASFVVDAVTDASSPL